MNSRKVKRRTYSGVVLEVEIFAAGKNQKLKTKSDPKLRFKDEEERAAHRLSISRRHHARLVNANFGTDSLYSTLTFNDENECHDFQEARKLRDLYFRRLKRKYPEAVIFIYMGRGKNTNRIHLHMLSKGVPAEFVTAQWKYGSIIDCKRLREHNYYDGVDRGKDYTALANYLFEHWTPEQGGHRWKQTRNARQPERENMTECKRNYTPEKPPRVPQGYRLVDVQITRYGYMNFRYVLEPQFQGISKKRRRL